MQVGAEKERSRERNSGVLPLAKNAEDVRNFASNILGGTLVTIQTGEAGKVVNKVLVAQDVYYPGAKPGKRILSIHFA